MKIRRMLPIFAAMFLFCSCGKSSDGALSIDSVKESSDVQTESVTEAATALVTGETTVGLPVQEGELTAYYWSDYDLAFQYPAAYTIAPADSDNTDSEILSAETDDTADGMVRIAVRKGCFPADDFAELDRIDVCNMMGLDAQLMVWGEMSDVELQHLSGLEANARKFTISSCQYGDTSAILTILLVNCFETDCLYAMSCASTTEAYDEYCQNLEDYFYLGNCSVGGNTVTQRLQPVDQRPQEIDMGYGCTFSLPADWRESADSSEMDYDNETSQEFVTADGDYLLLSTDAGLSDDQFEALMETQQIGDGSGGLTITGKEARTVNGYSAYLINETRPSWGLSENDTVPVYTWYINQTGKCFAIVCMLDVSGTQTDFILHPEEYLTFS